MSIHPVVTLAELDALDDNLCVMGYMHGRDNTPDYTQRDKAYWHGYLNGEVDAGRVPISTEQQRLAALYVARSRAH